MVEHFDDEMEMDFPTDTPDSELIPVGRYLFETIEAEKTTTPDGQFDQFKVTLEIDEGREDKRTILDYLPKGGRNRWKLAKFLYAIKIRNPGQKWVLRASALVGTKGFVDVGHYKKELEDGRTILKHVVNGYSPIEEEEAPIQGVPPETEEKKPEDKKEISAEDI